MNKIDSFFEPTFLIPNKVELSEITILQNHFNIILPKDYLIFIEKYDGGEGFTNSNKFLTLWGLSDLLEINTTFHNNNLYPKFFSKYFFIGKNAGPTLYAFSTQNNKVFEVPEICFEDIEVHFFANSFLEFVDKYCNT